MSDPGIYDKLAVHLHSMPIGAPKTPELMGILKILFTEAEAELAVNLPFFPMTLDQLVERAGLGKDRLEPMLEEMAGKGTVFIEMETPERMYRLLPTVIGFSETPFWSGKRTPEAEKLAPLWREYGRKAFYHEVGGLSETPLTRVIPLQETLEDTRKVSDFDKVAELVNGVSFHAVAHCPCRLMRDYSGEGKCEHSTENCLHFGSLARYMVAQGMAREIKKEETLAILKRSREEGLVHMTANFQGEVDTICNCCSDACVFLTGLLNMGEKNMFARSNFVSRVDEDSCAACGTCEERCPVNAISQDDGPALVDAARCIGCGVCCPSCPSDAISLVERPEEEQKPLLPPDQMIMNVMKDKNREFKF